MRIPTTSHKFCEQIAMDIVGPLPITNNGNLTKFIRTYAMDSHDAKTTAIHLFQHTPYTCTYFYFIENIYMDFNQATTSSIKLGLLWPKIAETGLLSATNLDFTEKRGIS
ncbi:hypothetical protein HHI36_001180 [Cryptolaemus montrouzieri]|uniref:Uncharacterized protein n=1 Tax=Cryptolaemus montrouzieri TaxID=559131 RepID=A0ABD2P6Y0_9CUCU